MAWCIPSDPSAVWLLYDSNCAAEQHSTYICMCTSCGDDNEDCNCCTHWWGETQIPDAWIISGGVQSWCLVTVNFRKVVLHLWSHCWTTYKFCCGTILSNILSKHIDLGQLNRGRAYSLWWLMGVKGFWEMWRGQFGERRAVCRCDAGNIMVWKNNS